MNTYKKGTVIVLHSTCNYIGCDDLEKFTLEEDMTEEQLGDLATEYAMETVAPEGWFEVAEEDEE